MRRVLFVYALAARGPERIAGAGVAGERLDRVIVGGVEAVVGEVARAPRASVRNLKRYNRVVSSLWERRAAVLPVRFGTVVRGRVELEFMLQARQESFRRQLQKVRRRAQMTVRIVGDEGSGIGDRAIPNPQSPIPEPRSPGTSYLRARARRHDVPEFAALRAAVRPWVREEYLQKHGSIATMYHLVPRGAVDRYRQAIERVARAEHLRPLVSGPWPAYAFAGGW